MTSQPITAAPARVLSTCTACLLGQAHAVHDTSLPVAQRSSITVPAPRVPDPDIPGYLAEAVPPFPSI